MKIKYIFQIVQDTLMVIILLLLMGYHLWSENTHEWLGIIFLLFVGLHIRLNLTRLKNIFIRKYALYNYIGLFINIALAISFIGAISSGLMLSRHLFPDLIIHNSSDWMRKIHMTSVHWIPIIIALHLGFHWQMLANFLCDLWKISRHDLFVRHLLTSVWLVISLYGAYVFTERNMLSYLLMRVDFAFFDFEEPKITFYWDYFSILILFSCATHYLLALLFFKEKGFHILPKRQ